MNEEEYKVLVQDLYREYREISGRSTKECLDFLKWMHEKHNGLKYLEDMQDLTTLERDYINHLLNN